MSFFTCTSTCQGQIFWISFAYTDPLTYANLSTWQLLGMQQHGSAREVEIGQEFLAVHRSGSASCPFSGAFSRFLLSQLYRKSQTPYISAKRQRIISNWQKSCSFTSFESTIILTKIKRPQKKLFYLFYFWINELIIGIEKNHTIERGRQNFFGDSGSTVSEISLRNIALPQWRKSQNINSLPNTIVNLSLLFFLW